LEKHLAAEREARRLEKRVRRDRRRLTRGDEGMVPRFRAILELLEECGYLHGWELTDRGRKLRSIYNEMDLLIAEALEQRLFAGLDAAETAALVSAFTFEPRTETEPAEWPTEALARRGERLEAIRRRLDEAERRAGLGATRGPEAGFATTAYRWTSGESLETIFGEDPAGIGDFVRNCRQLLDVLRQIADVAPETVEQAMAAVQSIDRGVVAAVRPT
jgi:ATP-dependent RNA helicase HelY